jgi:hypothetical protein
MGRIDLKAQLEKYTTRKDKLEYLLRLVIVKMRVCTNNPKATFRSLEDGFMHINKLIPRKIFASIIYESVNSVENLSITNNNIITACLPEHIGNPENDRFFNRGKATNVIGYIYNSIVVLSLLNATKPEEQRISELTTCLTVLLKFNYNDNLLDTIEKRKSVLLFILVNNPPLKILGETLCIIYNNVTQELNKFFEREFLLPSGFNNEMTSLLNPEERRILGFFKDINMASPSKIEERLEAVFGNLIDEIASFDDSKDPFHIAANFFLYFNEIHPFSDANGRVSRSLVDDILYSLLPKTHPLCVSENGVFTNFAHEAAVSSDESIIYYYVIDTMNIDLIKYYLCTNKFTEQLDSDLVSIRLGNTNNEYALRNTLAYLSEKLPNLQINIESTKSKPQFRCVLM